MTALAPTSTGQHPDDTLRSWHEWRAARDRALSAPHGWLSLTALHWLGARPAASGDLPGLWWSSPAGIHLLPERTAGGPDVALDGVPLVEETLVWRAAGDHGGAPGPVGTLTHGERLIEPLERGGAPLGGVNRGLRVRDPQAPALRSFTGVPTFDHDPGWRLLGTLRRHPAPERVELGSAAGRVRHVQELVGEVSFRRDGVEHVLQVAGGDRLSVTFRDATNGRQTAAFRVLTLEAAPDGAPDGTVVVDLNRAENPPCAFTDHGTCPLPPAANTLAVAVLAGERTPTGR